MKIIVGVDDSPHSKAALKWVRQMTWPAGTKVTVVSAVRPLVMAYAEAYAPAVAIQEADQEQLKYHRELTVRAENELRDAGLTADARVLSGDPREVLVNTARAEGAQLIVVGSHGRSGLAKLLLGSVAAHVVTHAPCNVMVVKL